MRESKSWLVKFKYRNFLIGILKLHLAISNLASKGSYIQNKPTNISREMNNSNPLNATHNVSSLIALAKQMVCNKERTIFMTLDSTKMLGQLNLGPKRQP